MPYFGQFGAVQKIKPWSTSQSAFPPIAAEPLEETVISADAFKQAAWNSDFETVKRYVESDGDVNACGDNGVGALVSFDLKWNC